jgi:organic hydroperoxide reductase OsmC/OhrA
LGDHDRAEAAGRHPIGGPRLSPASAEDAQAQSAAAPLVHRYSAALAWHGSTAAGLQDYSRDHLVSCYPARDELALSSDPHFRGTAARLNPEQLLVAAASSCQLLSFLAVAARARVDVFAYIDNAEGFMSESGRPMRIERVVLRPEVAVRGQISEARVTRLLDLAHQECFIANSLLTEITIEPVVTITAD